MTRHKIKNLSLCTKKKNIETWTLEQAVLFSIKFALIFIFNCFFLLDLFRKSQDDCRVKSGTSPF